MRGFFVDRPPARETGCTWLPNAGKSRLRRSAWQPRTRRIRDACVDGASEPSGTKEQYDEVCSRLTDGKGLESLSDWPTDGILSHAAGPIDGGWRVIDIWESEEAFQRFGEVIGPLLQEVGMPGQPQLFELHNFVK